VDELNRRAADWLQEAERTHAILPNGLRQDPAIFRYALESGLTDYDRIVKELNHKAGDRYFIPNPEEKRLFDELMKSPGTSFAERTQSYLLRFNQMPLETAWAEFSRAPTQEMAAILSKRHLKDLSNEQIAELVEWVLDPAVSDQRLSTAGGLLNELFQGPRAQALFSPKVDEILARELFRPVGKNARVSLTNLIIAHSESKDFPKLYSKLISVVRSDQSSDAEIFRALSFVIPERPEQRTSAPWGRTVVDAIWKSKDPSVSELEVVAEYFRLVVGRHEWGRRAGTQLDRSARDAGLRALGERPEELRDAAAKLWAMMAHKSPQVRAAATYAVASSPPFYLALEARFVEELAKSAQNSASATSGTLASSSPYRRAALQLAGMSLPGFSPPLDLALTKAAPYTAAEHASLALRSSPIRCIRDILSTRKQKRPGPLAR
jgi:hypothetical protein